MTEEIHPRALPAAQTLPELLVERAAASPDEAAQWLAQPGSGWRARSWLEYARRAAGVAHGLREAGLMPGERVGILAPTSADWDVAQMGVLAARGVVVGLDPFESDERLGAIVERAGVTTLIVASEAAFSRLRAVARDRLRRVFVIGDDLCADRELIPLAGFARGGIPGDAAWSQAQPADPATIVFTSGSTGRPKGVLYTHGQVCLAVRSILAAFPDIGAGSRLACWLPLANLFQRMLNFCAIGRGAQTFYVADPRTIVEQAAAIAPHVFIAVPRFYEKLHAGIRAKLREAPWPAPRVAEWALRQGRAAAVRGREPTSLGERIGHGLAEKLVLARVRGIMGPNLRYFISGSAPMPKWLLDEFAAIGWTVFEAYGTSENVVPVCANRPGAHKAGTVGKPMPGNEVRLAADGEVLVRGEGVFSGYYGEPDERPPIDAEGFLATGDLAERDAEGFFTLVGRKSEIFKTSTGRRVAPAAVEALLRRCPGVEYAAVFGAGRRSPVAILAISMPGDAPARASGLGETWPAWRDALARAVQPLAGHERPAGYILTTRPFTPQSGELTANLKLRRGAIEQGFRAELDELFAALERGGSAPGAVIRVMPETLVAIA